MIAFMVATDIIASADGKSVVPYDAARKALCWAREPLLAVRSNVPPTRREVGTAERRQSAVRPQHAERCDEYEFSAPGGEGSLHKYADRLTKKMERLKGKLAADPAHPDGVWVGDAALAWVIVRRPDVAVANVFARGSFGEDVASLFARCVERSQGREYWDAVSENLLGQPSLIG